MPDADPHLEMAELNLASPITGAAADWIGAQVVQLLLEPAVTGQLPAVVAVTLRGTTGRMWRLVDVDPIDDLVRALCQREEAEAVVVVAPAPAPPELEGDRCVAFSTECAVGAFEHVVVLRATPEGDQFRIGARPSDGRTPFRWLGVPPAGHLDLWVEGLVGLPRTGPRSGGSA